MRELALEIRNLAAEEDDFDIANEFEDHIAGYNKTSGLLNQCLFN